jgi:hypothetical protein
MLGERCATSARVPPLREAGAWSVNRAYDGDVFVLRENSPKSRESAIDAGGASLVRGQPGG